MRYFIQLSYDGTAYHGWQVQDGDETVQQHIEAGLRFKLGLKESVTGCGRTDTGVHARRFYAHFDLEKKPEATQLEKFVFELNNFLPKDIAVYRVFSVHDDAHARFDAISRTYKYYINTVKDPFSERFAWTYRVPLDLEAMNQAAATLKNHTDFTSFAKLHSDVKTNNCKISTTSWSRKGGQLVFTITADRFLRNMVRAIVGTLVEVGRGKRTPEDFEEVVLRKDRSAAGMSAPAKGLFLEDVDYEWDKIVLK